MADREIKLEQGDWGSLVMARTVYKYGGYTPNWEMITDRRETWWGHDNIHHHPDSPLQKIDGCCQNASYVVCPYCGNENEPDSHDYDGCDSQCYECERTFSVEASFGYGFSTEPLPCKHHHWVFEAQYAHFSERDSEWSTWRNLICINCGHDNNSSWPMKKYGYVDGKWTVNNKIQPIFTLLPWLDEYNDPDFFDPEGVLETGVDLGEKYATPILDFLRNRYNGWAGGYSDYAAKNAIEAHEKAYGVKL